MHSGWITAAWVGGSSSSSALTWSARATNFRTPVLDAGGKPKLDKQGNPVLTPDTRYFQPRPSTATNYNPAATAFTNLGPNSKEARDTFKANLNGYLRLERPYDRSLGATRVPVDAVTSSASGVDPHISPANAAIQADRIARVRRLPLARVRKLIADNTDGRFLGVLGEPGVNVLELNLALDRLRTHEHDRIATDERPPIHEPRAERRSRSLLDRSILLPAFLPRSASSTRACRSATR